MNNIDNTGALIEETGGSASGIPAVYFGGGGNMAGQSEIRHHIAAVEQTQKITAHGMVASTRMKRVLSHIEQNRRYFDSVRRTMKEILANSEGVKHPYLRNVPENGSCRSLSSRATRACAGHTITMSFSWLWKTL
jgi:hypothetical protein